MEWQPSITASLRDSNTCATCNPTHQAPHTPPHPRIPKIERRDEVDGGRRGRESPVTETGIRHQTSAHGHQAASDTRHLQGTPPEHRKCAWRKVRLQGAGREWVPWRSARTSLCARGVAGGRWRGGNASACVRGAEEEGEESGGAKGTWGGLSMSCRACSASGVSLPHAFSVDTVAQAVRPASGTEEWRGRGKRHAGRACERQARRRYQ